MVSRQDTHDFFILIQNRIAGFSVLQYLFLHIIQFIIQVEAHQTLCTADPSNGGGLKNQSGSSVGITRGGDDAGFRFHFQQFRIQFRPAQNQTVHVSFQRLTNQVRLIAADHNAVAFGKDRRAPALWNRKDDFSGYRIKILSGLIDHLALQHGQNIE